MSPANVDFPTPPFADETAIAFFTSGMRRFAGSPRLGICGGGLREGIPYV